MKWSSIEKLENESNISIVEEKFGIKFPLEFIDLIREYNHGTAFPDTFDTNKLKGKAFGRLLSFNLNSKYNILYEYDLIKEKLPPLVFPFSGDAGGNYLCYNYKENINEPSVVFWDHEQTFEINDDDLVIPDHERESDYYYLEPVSNNLNELLQKLYGEEDYEDNHEEIIWEDFMDEDGLKVLDDEDLKAVNVRRIKKGLRPITNKIFNYY